jgi:hypothetical protein
MVPVFERFWASIRKRLLSQTLNMRVLPPRHASFVAVAAGRQGNAPPLIPPFQLNLVVFAAILGDGNSMVCIAITV